MYRLRAQLKHERRDEIRGNFAYCSLGICIVSYGKYKSLTQTEYCDNI